VVFLHLLQPRLLQPFSGLNKNKLYTNGMSGFFGIIISIFLTIGSLFGISHPQQVGPNSNPVSAQPVSSTQQPSGSVSASTGSATNTSGGLATPSSSAPSGTYATYGHIYSTSELAAMAGPVDLTSLPLGDSKYTISGPKQGYVYICNVMSGGKGAVVNGPWIHGTTWDQTAKVIVQGNVSWPDAYANFTTSNGMRYIKSNDEPTNSTTGVFPIPRSDPAFQYDGNQSSITAQNTSLSFPEFPTIANSPNCMYGVVGVMTNGVSLNDAFDALYRDAPAHEEQDSCNGHPNNEGYHYHNLSSCFKTPLETQVIGWADDGFPITGPEVSSGNYLTTSDLDECHGLTSTININGQQVTTYHYVMTYDFPYSVSCFRGKSYEPHPGGGAIQSTQSTQTTQPPSSQQGQPPQAAIDACSGKSANTSCTVSTPNGTLYGTCKTPPGQSSLACVPN